MAEPKEPSEEQQEQPKKKGKWKLMILILLVVLGAGSGAAYYLFPEKVGSLIPFLPARGQVQKEHKPEPGVMVMLEPFLFNLTGSASKFAKVSVGLEVKDSKIGEEVKKLMPAIRDKALAVLCSRTSEGLMDVAQRESMKKEMTAGLKALFKAENDLRMVYITDIIIQ